MWFLDVTAVLFAAIFRTCIASLLCVGATLRLVSRVSHATILRHKSRKINFQLEKKAKMKVRDIFSSCARDSLQTKL